MTKDELKDIITLNARIKSKIRQLEELKKTRYTIQGMDYSKDKVQTPITNAIENTAIKIADFELEINNDIAELIDMKNKATKTINNIQGIYGTILEMRYLECMRWEEIAYRLCYTINHVFKLHGQALQKLKEDSK